MNLRPSANLLRILCLFAVTVSAVGKELMVPAKLTVKGKSEWRVYVPKSAGEVERFAAGEFNKYVEEMSGAKLLAVEKPGRSFTVQIGLRKDLGTIDGLP